MVYAVTNEVNEPAQKSITARLNISYCSLLIKSQKNHSTLPRHSIKEMFYVDKIAQNSV
jgi:hypothetical protein